MTPLGAKVEGGSEARAAMAAGAEGRTDAKTLRTRGWKGAATVPKNRPPNLKIHAEAIV